MDIDKTHDVTMEGEEKLPSNLDMDYTGFVLLSLITCFQFTNIYIFYYMGFLLRIFTIHRTAGEGGGYLFYSSLRLPLKDI